MMNTLFLTSLTNSSSSKAPISLIKLKKDCNILSELLYGSAIFWKPSKLVATTFAQENSPLVISVPSTYKFCAIFITFLLSYILDFT